MGKTQTPETLKAQAKALAGRAKELKKTRDRRITTFSHFVMAGIMFMFFVGAGLGIYVTVFREEPVSTTLEYIMKLAYIVSLGYFIKAFGENIAKIVLSAVFGARKPPDDSNLNNTNNEGGVG